MGNWTILQKPAKRITSLKVINNFLKQRWVFYILASDNIEWNYGIMMVPLMMYWLPLWVIVFWPHTSTVLFCKYWGWLHLLQVIMHHTLLWLADCDPHSFTKLFPQCSSAWGFSYWVFDLLHFILVEIFFTVFWMRSLVGRLPF